MEARVKQGYWQEVIGWFDALDLYDEVAMTTPTGSVVVEVGVAFGKSLLYLAEKIAETGKQIQIIAVDKWEPYPEASFIWNKTADMPDSERVAYECAEKHNGIFAAFLHNLYHSGYANNVSVVRMDSVQAAASFKAAGIKPHFVFIDAAHDYDNVKRDIDAWWETGPDWMAGHDYNRGQDNFPGVWKAVDEKFADSDPVRVERDIEWRGQTCWVVRRAHLERPNADTATAGE